MAEDEFLLEFPSLAIVKPAICTPPAQHYSDALVTPSSLRLLYTPPGSSGRPPVVSPVGVVQRARDAAYAACHNMPLPARAATHIDLARKAKTNDSALQRIRLRLLYGAAGHSPLRRRRLFARLPLPKCTPFNNIRASTWPRRPRRAPCAPPQSARPAGPPRRG